MVEGLWIAQYEGMQGSGGTVLVLVDGQVLGGDNGFTIIGKYAVTGNDVTAEVSVQNYLKSVQNFFEFEGDYKARLRGKIDGNVIAGKVEIIDKHVPGLALKLTRVKKLARNA